MKYKIEREFDNILLHRREFNIIISDVNKTPSREDILKHFSAKQGLDAKRIIIDDIKTNFGSRIFKVFIKSYASEDFLKKIESKSNLKKWENLNKKTEVKQEEKKEEKKE